MISNFIKNTVDAGHPHALSFSDENIWIIMLAKHELQIKLYFIYIMADHTYIVLKALQLVCASYADVPVFSESDNIISVLSTTYSTATIKWMPATTLPIAAVNRYIIHAFNDMGFQRDYSTSDGDTLNFTINELEPSTKYHINVVAINTVGQSAPTGNISLTTRAFGKQGI